MQLEFNLQRQLRDGRIHPFDPSRYTHTILAQPLDLLLVLFDDSFMIFAGRQWSVSLPSHSRGKSSTYISASSLSCLFKAISS